MARTMGGMDRVAPAARWALASPRLARTLAGYTALVLGAGVVTAVARSHDGRSSSGPVFALAEAVEARPAWAHTAASRSSATSRRPASKRRSAARSKEPAGPPVKAWAYWAPRVRLCE